MSWLAPVLVAVIGGPIMWLLARLDRRNTTQHGQSLAQLDRLDHKLDRHDHKLDRLADRIDSHIDNKEQHYDRP